MLNAAKANETDDTVHRFGNKKIDKITDRKILNPNSPQMIELKKV